MLAPVCPAEKVAQRNGWTTDEGEGVARDGVCACSENPTKNSWSKAPYTTEIWQLGGYKIYAYTIECEMHEVVKS